MQQFSSMLSENALRRPQQTALRCDERRKSWQDLVRDVEYAASALRQQGVGSGERVAILAETSLSWVEIFLGCLRIGACAVPLSSWDEAGALGRKLRDARPRLLAASAAQRSLLRQAQQLGARLPERRLALDFQAPGWASYPQDADLPPLAATTTAPEADVDIIYSSGTTGEPKGIRHCLRMRAFQAQRMGRLGLGPDARCLLSTPLCSNTTLTALLPTLVLGGCALLMPRFDVRGFLERCARWRATHAMLVPVQLQRLLALPDLGDLSSLQTCFCTSAPLSLPLKRQILARWPGRLVEIYGQTEGGCTTLLDLSAYPDKLHTVGRPAAGVQVRILDPQGRPQPPRRAGEVAGRAPSMMSGYHDRPDLTERISWRDPQGRVFYRTGDLGRLDEDGFLELTGRTSEVIISGGFNVHAGDLERTLAEHPAVAQVAVVGVPSPRWGESPVAVVVLRDPHASDEDTLRTWANARLGKTQRLAAVVLRPELPRNAIGKADKRRLAAELQGLLQRYDGEFPRLSEKA